MINFNCGIAYVEVKGEVAHTGYAKNRMVNSMHIAMELHSLLNPLEIPGQYRRKRRLYSSGRDSRRCGNYLHAVSGPGS